MSLQIECINQQEKEIKESWLDLVRHLLQAAAEMEQVGAAEVAITFVDNEAIQALNRDYRGIDRATDVLSFAMNETGEGEILVEEEEIPTMLGDIVISIPRAEEQAEEYAHSFERELGFLAVHGFLHLLGYDHQTEEQEKQMFDLQEKILQKCHLPRSTET